MPHLHELREVLTWIGVTLLPLGLIVSAARAYLAPGVDGESPSELLARVLAAAIGLLLYDWAWGVLVRLVKLVTDGLLGLPWVADGIERMLETLLIGGATGSAVAAEFVIPLLVLFAGGTLLGLVLVHVGLMVATSLVYVLGGLVLGLSVTSFGRRLLAAWLLAASAVVVLPVLWSVVFVTGSALMLDAQPAAGDGFAGFVAQLFNVAAAAGTFFVAIKLSLAVFRNATGAITGITSAGPASGGARAASAVAGRPAALAANATPAGLARFSAQMRGRAAALASGGARVAVAPIAHPARTLGTAARVAAHPVQSTQQAAGSLRAALTGSSPAAAAANATAHAGAAHPGRADAFARPPASPTATGSSGVDITPSNARAGAGTDAPPAAGDRGPSARRSGDSSRRSAPQPTPPGRAAAAAPATVRSTVNPAGPPAGASEPRGDTVPRPTSRTPTTSAHTTGGAAGRARWWPLARKTDSDEKRGGR
ncbi:hypothetical protein DVA67_030720 [Solirubrobacter sp. CPCC 204708]|nr:hypothetical protein [Solirubrobacter deserti]